MMDWLAAYPAIKWIHVGSVMISVSLFVVRGALMLVDSPLLKSRLLRITPHLVDTVLLFSAVLLTLRLHQYPFVNGWLTAKVAGLLVYIVLGSIALKRGRTRRSRIIAFIFALLAVAYIISVACTRSPFGILAPL